MKKLLEQLTQATGPTGYEGEVRELVKSLVQEFADEIYTDVMGNLIVRKGTRKENGLKIMLSAHIDEIGVAVTHIDDNGYVRFTNLGGVRPTTCYSGRVKFTNGTIGIIGTEPVKSATEVHPLSELFIDIGVSSKEEVSVKVGDFGCFMRPFVDLGYRLVSKAMDDRAGAAVLIELLKQIGDSPHEFYFVFSTQEEVGLRGAKTAAYRINPDIGIALDVTLTGDTPKARTMDVSLGKGPAIKVKDSGMIASPALVRAFCEVAESNEIPYQMEVLVGGTTDAAAIQVTRVGVPTGCISIPCRYVHSPSEMIDLHDMENAVKLLVAMLQDPIKLI